MTDASDNVVFLDVESRLPVPVPRVIEGATVADLAQVLIVGRRRDGELYVASSFTDAEALHWLLSRVQFKLLRGDFT